ncbi:CheR family methyltransferase [Tautonia plasticadhaerens]|uniref:protein-glutamate O-methyltransferase n=1 Tax=Tautonia plasticadhaerens TaxID=2527974 RepID=A0A518H7L5_9BACT|nr:protein-glutamate O-methyltransferase CheR [Tautonia plasticadhaerens]QDV36850.1 Chemotaxis protein methyltransferase [Tautonia plasticadhaerens]
MNQDLLPDDLFESFRAMIYRATGIRIPETKRVMLSNRLRRRVVATGVGGFAEYFARLSAGVDRDEQARFIDAVTTRETYFFRDEHHFRWLAGRFAPELVERARRGRRERSMSIWSAASSGGEELYSALIALAEAHQPPSGWALHALGTDISDAALESARAASFGDRSLRSVTPEVLRRWFSAEGPPGRRSLREELRRRASFRRHNLLEPMRDGPFDCIFLKNVLIYFDPASKKVAVGHVLDAMAPGGYLVVGPTEGIFSMLDPLERVEGWLYRKAGGD